MLPPDGIRRRGEEFAKLYEAIGMADEAASLYGDLARNGYLHRPVDGFVDGMRRNGHGGDADALLDELLEKEAGCGTIHVMGVSNLIACGRPEAADIVSTCGTVDSWDWRFRRDTEDAVPRLVRRLDAIGRCQEAAEMGRGLAEYRLKSRKADLYRDGAEILAFMAKDPRYEHVVPPHSEYMADLRSRYGARRNFWGIYNSA